MLGFAQKHRKENKKRKTNRPYGSRLPPHLEALMGQANTEFMNGNFEACIKHCEEVTQASKTYADAYLTLSSALEAVGRWEASADAKATGLELRTARGSWDEYEHVATLYGRAKKGKEHITFLKKATQNEMAGGELTGLKKRLALAYREYGEALGRGHLELVWLDRHLSDLLVAKPKFNSAGEVLTRDAHPSDRNRRLIACMDAKALKLEIAETATRLVDLQDTQAKKPEVVAMKRVKLVEKVAPRLQELSTPHGAVVQNLFLSYAEAQVPLGRLGLATKIRDQCREQIAANPLTPEERADLDLRLKEVSEVLTHAQAEFEAGDTARERSKYLSRSTGGGGGGGGGGAGAGAGAGAGGRSVYRARAKSKKASGASDKTIAAADKVKHTFLIQDYAEMTKTLRRRAHAHAAYSPMWDLLQWVYSRSIATDAASHRFLVRQMMTHPNALPVILLKASFAFGSGTYRHAIGLYYRALQLAPKNSVVHLLLGAAYVHAVFHKFTMGERSRPVVLALTAMDTYRKLRLEDAGADDDVDTSRHDLSGRDPAPWDEEIHTDARLFNRKPSRALRQAETKYNLARAYHVMSLLDYAIQLYEEVLAMPEHVFTAHSDVVCFDIRREAAFNLAQILRTSGRRREAYELCRMYIKF